MGVLNVTPDSFFDGGRYQTLEAAEARASRMVEEGADLIDVGGESSRPGAAPVPVDEELRRAIPVIERLAHRFPAVPLSIDTTKAEVARHAIHAGARIVNDISALRGDPDMAPLVARTGVTVILMHMQGEPASMQSHPSYQEVAGDLQAFFAERLGWAAQQGISRQAIWLDPGIGFGKTVSHNLTLLRRLGEFRRFALPLVVGTSRKSFLGPSLPPEERLEGSLVTALWAVLHGTKILRVHDVQATVRALQALEAIRRSE